MSKTPEMVERVAHACSKIATINYKAGYESGGPPTCHIGKENEWRNWEWLIRKVIFNEMCDLTEAMLDRGARVALATGTVLTTVQVHDIWQAMNDEALAEDGDG